MLGLHVQISRPSQGGWGGGGGGGGGGEVR